MFKLNLLFYKKIININFSKSYIYHKHLCNQYFYKQIFFQHDLFVFIFNYKYFN